MTIELHGQDQSDRHLCELFPLLEALDAAPGHRGGPGSPAFQAILPLLRRMEREDRALRDHGLRTAVYATALGQAAGLSQGELTDLCCAALLHDIGKLALPKAILRKPGPLSLDEYALVQCHPRVGAECLEDAPSLRVPAVLIAHHHERWDGTGYPYGLPGRLIPRGSRILAVADTFDALTAERSYRPARTIGEALRLMSVLAGTQLDPDLVRACTALVDDPDRLSGRDVPPARPPFPTSGTPGGASPFLRGPRLSFSRFGHRVP